MAQAVPVQAVAKAEPVVERPMTVCEVDSIRGSLYQASLRFGLKKRICSFQCFKVRLGAFKPLDLLIVAVIEKQRSGKTRRSQT